MQPVDCPEGKRLCGRERRPHRLADFLDINPRGYLATKHKLKGYYNQCHDCVECARSYSKGEPQIPLDVRRERRPCPLADFLDVNPPRLPHDRDRKEAQRLLPPVPRMRRARLLLKITQLQNLLDYASI